jgi:hypothetical protein
VVGQHQAGHAVGRRNVRRFARERHLELVLKETFWGATFTRGQCYNCFDKV